MAFDAAHARVWRYSVRDKFGLHRFVAGLAAESDRFGMFVSAITAKRAHENKNHGHANESKEYTPTLRIIEINSGKLGDLLWREAPSSPSLPQHSHPKHCQTNDRTDGQKHIGENPEIGRASSLKKFEQEQQYNARKAGKGNGGANKAYVITGEAGAF